jgi:hypothetical protein
MGHAAIINAAVAVGIALTCLVVGRMWGLSNLKSQVENALQAAHKTADAREFTLREQLEEKLAEVARLQPVAEELKRLQKQLQREKPKQQIKQDSAAVATSDADSSEDAVETTPPVQSADLAIQKLLQSLESTLQEPEQQSTSAPAPEENKVAAIQAAVEPEPVTVAAPRPTLQPSPPAVPPAPPRSPAMPPAEPRQAPRPASAAAAPVTPPRPSPQPRSVPAPQPAARISPAAPGPAEASKPRPVPPQPGPLSPRPHAKSGSTPGSGPVDEWQEFAKSLAALTQRKE